MKGLVQTNVFHSEKCVFNLRTEGCCLNSDHVSVSLCPLHESLSCTGSHFSTSELFPFCHTPHSRPGSFTKRGRCFKGDPWGLFSCSKDTSPSNTRCITFNLLAVRVFLWFTGELDACQTSVPIISAEPWYFFQAARKQSGYKRFWLLFFTRCVGLSGR